MFFRPSLYASSGIWKQDLRVMGRVFYHCATGENLYKIDAWFQHVQPSRRRAAGSRRSFQHPTFRKVESDGVADERDAVADERDAIADERDTVADEAFSVAQRRRSVDENHLSLRHFGESVITIFSSSSLMWAAKLERLFMVSFFRPSLLPQWHPMVLFKYRLTTKICHWQALQGQILKKFLQQ